MNIKCAAVITEVECFQIQKQNSHDFPKIKQKNGHVPQFCVQNQNKEGKQASRFMFSAVHTEFCTLGILFDTLEMVFFQGWTVAILAGMAL